MVRIVLISEHLCNLQGLLSDFWPSSLPLWTQLNLQPLNKACLALAHSSSSEYLVRDISAIFIFFSDVTLQGGEIRRGLVIYSAFVHYISGLCLRIVLLYLVAIALSVHQDTK